MFRSPKKKYKQSFLPFNKSSAKTNKIKGTTGNKTPESQADTPEKSLANALFQSQAKTLVTCAKSTADMHGHDTSRTISNESTDIFKSSTASISCSESGASKLESTFEKYPWIINNKSGYLCKYCRKFNSSNKGPRNSQEISIKYANILF